MPDDWWMGDDKATVHRFPRWDVREHSHSVPVSDIEGGASKRRLCVSAEWVKHIVGVLDRLTRIDAWDGEQADIERAISNVERMMVQLATNVDDCIEVVTITETVIKTVVEHIGGGSPDIGENEMPCLSMPDLIKIEDGKLWGRNSCCEWEIIGELSLSSPSVADEQPADGTGAEPEEWAPCGKMAGLVSAILSMLAAAEDNYAVVGDFIPAVRDSVPGGVEMGRTALYLLWLDYVSFRKVFSYATLTDEDMVQKMLCRGVLGMQDNGTVTYDEYSFAANSIKSAIYDGRDYATATAIFTVWEQCYQTIGYEDSRFLMQLGAYNITADCTCPDADPTELWGDAYDWKIDWKLTEGQPAGTTLDVSNGISVITDDGLTITVDDTGTESAGIRRAKTSDAFTVKAVYVEFYAHDWTSSEWGLFVNGGINPAQSLVTGSPSKLTLYRDDLLRDGSLETDIGISLQGNFDGAETPPFPVILRYVVAGDGTHPFA